jgi:hypothetical protein
VLLRRLHEELLKYCTRGPEQPAWAEQQQADAEECGYPPTTLYQQQQGNSRSNSSSTSAEFGGVTIAHALPDSDWNPVDQSTEFNTSKDKAGMTAAAAAAAANQSSTALGAAVLRLFGSTTGCLGVPGTCYRVCAVPDAAGGIAGMTYCLEQYTPGAADSLADVLSSMKASLLPGIGFSR